MNNYERSDEGIPWIEKYRPKNVENIIAHNEIMNVLNKFIEKNNLPHLLFYGPPGTCKTTTARAIANKIYNELSTTMVLELNASDERGINVVRDKIKEFACTQKIFNAGVKMIILDEVDAMTNEAQFALRRIIEKYTENVRFCLICNYVNKVIPALQSRCTKFRFSYLEKEQIKEYMENIIKKEGINMDESAKNIVLEICNGDMRRLLNILQIIYTMSKNDYEILIEKRLINENDVLNYVGIPLNSDIERIYEILMNDNICESYKKINKILRIKGYILSDIIKGILKIIKNLKYDESDNLVKLIVDMSDIEYRLSNTSNEKIQLASLISSFYKYKIGINC